MKLNLLNTPHGLVPMYDADYDERKKLRLGQTYVADIRVPRNYQFHKLAFALINAAYACLPEAAQNGFRSVDGFRQYITVAAGYYDVFFNPRLCDWVEIPKSWSFSSMDDAEFREFYDRLKDAIWGVIGQYVTEEQFETILANF